MLYEVIIDSSETPNKCTIAPLAHRPDFRLFRVKGSGALGPLNSPILLHHEGQCLTTIHKSFSEISGIATVDCVWKRLEGLLKRIAEPRPTFARIPDGFETAYPRRSENNSDPTGGLATIEAIFVAAALLGKWDVSLLSEYYFGRKFIELNAKQFLDLGVHQASNLEALPMPSPRSRNSKQRRHARGKY